MFAVRGLPPGVLLHTRRDGDLQLGGEIIHDLDRHIARIGQKCPEIADGPELNANPEPAVIATTPAHQDPVRVVEEEEPLQLHTLGWPVVAAVRSRLLISHELHRHGPTTYGPPPASDQPLQPLRSGHIGTETYANTPPRPQGRPIPTASSVPYSTFSFRCSPRAGPYGARSATGQAAEHTDQAEEEQPSQDRDERECCLR